MTGLDGSSNRASWKNRRTALLLAISLALGALVHLQTLSYGFVYDDKPLIVDNPVIKDVRNIPHILLSEDIIDNVHAGYYRPLSPLPHMLDYYIWGLNPAGYHLSNIIYNLLAVLLVFLLCLRISGSAYAAFAASLFFGVHPANTEAVDFITGRNNMLCAVFTLASLLAFMKYREEGSRKKPLLAASVFSFLAGAAFKEFALMLPFVIVFYDLRRIKAAGEKSRPLDYAPFAAAAALYLGMRSYVLKGVAGTSLALPKLPLRMLSMPEVLLTYLRLSFVPLWLKAQYNIELQPTALKWICLAVLAALGTALFKYRKNRLVLYPALWFLAFLAPVMNVIPVSGSLMAERYLYIPLAGVSVFVGIVFERRMQKKRKAAITVFALYICALSALTVIRNPVWENDQALYTDMIRTEPSAYKGYYNLGNRMYKEGNLKEAQALWEKALAVRPDMYAVHNNLGVIYEKTGNYAMAEKHFRMILAVKPYAQVYQNLGNALYAEKKYAQAEDAYKKALEMDTSDIEGYERLSDFYDATGKPAQSLEILRLAATRMPYDYEAFNLLGAEEGRQKLYRAARADFTRALALNPTCSACARNLNMLAGIKQ